MTALSRPADALSGRAPSSGGATTQMRPERASASGSAPVRPVTDITVRLAWLQATFLSSKVPLAETDVLGQLDVRPGEVGRAGPATLT